MAEGERILVMDDDEAVCMVLGEVLETLGYTAHLVAGGHEAIELYRRAKNEGERFVAVIMDLTVPGGMGGEEAVKKLLEVDPKACVIVTSAYVTHPTMLNFAKHGFSGCIGKPFKIAQLRDTLSGVLKKTV